MSTDASTDDDPSTREVVDDWADWDNPVTVPTQDSLLVGEPSYEVTAASITATDPDGIFTVTDDEVFTSPEERAETRFQRLSTAFSATLAIVAQMYRDEDWRYLTKEDGSRYSSLVEVCQVAMGKSVAMARRYVQGAREFYLPLSEVMVEGTRVAITSGDVASLGQDGLREAVQDATERLQGVDDPEAASEAIDDALEAARERKRANDESSAPSDARWDDPDAAADDDGLFSSTPGGAAEERDAARSDSSQSVDDSGPDDALSPDSGDDVIGPLLAGAPLFDSDDALAELPYPARDVVAAMLVLENADLSELSRALEYRNRGIIVHSDNAQKALERLRALAATQPWVMQHLDQE